LLVSKEESILFLTLAAAGFLVCRIPYVGKLFRVFSTLFHEGGHALAAWLTKSEVLRIDLFYDTSGTTITKSNNRRSQIIISLAGYIFASALPFLFILLMSQGLTLEVHIAIVVFSALMLMLAVRNAFGIVWMIFMLTLYLVVIFAEPDAAWIMLYSFTGIMLVEALTSAVVVFWLSIVQPANAGDAANLNKTTILPVWFWGFFFLAQAVLFFYLSVLLLF